MRGGKFHCWLSKVEVDVMFRCRYKCQGFLVAFYFPTIYSQFLDLQQYGWTTPSSRCNWLHWFGKGTITSNCRQIWPLSYRMTCVVPSIVEVLMNKITFWISVRADGRTAERAIIASNVTGPPGALLFDRDQRWHWNNHYNCYFVRVATLGIYCTDFLPQLLAQVKYPMQFSWASYLTVVTHRYDQ